jgi:hypothetical protein
MAARHAEAHAFHALRGRLVAAGDDPVEQRAIGDARVIGPACRACERSARCGLRPSTGRGPEAHDAAQRCRDADRAAGVGSDAAGTSRAPTAAPTPPLDPPGMRVRS